MNAERFAAKLGMVRLPKRWSYTQRPEYFYVLPSEISAVYGHVDYDDNKMYSSVHFKGVAGGVSVDLPAEETLRLLAEGGSQ
jgi:hypothetical protein